MDFKKPHTSQVKAKKLLQMLNAKSNIEMNER